MPTAFLASIGLAEMRLLAHQKEEPARISNATCGKKLLAVKTMWKPKALAESATPKGGVPPTSETASEKGLQDEWPPLQIPDVMPLTGTSGKVKHIYTLPMDDST